MSGQRMNGAGLRPALRRLLGLCLAVLALGAAGAVRADVISADGRTMPLVYSDPAVALRLQFNGWLIFDQSGKVVASNTDKEGWDIPNYSQVAQEANLLSTGTVDVVEDVPPQCFLIQPNADTTKYPPGHYRFVAYYGVDICSYQFYGDFYTQGVSPPYTSWDGSFDPSQVSSNSPPKVTLHYHAGPAYSGQGCVVSTYPYPDGQAQRVDTVQISAGNPVDQPETYPFSLNGDAYYVQAQFCQATPGPPDSYTVAGAGDGQYNGNYTPVSNVPGQQGLVYALGGSTSGPFLYQVSGNQWEIYTELAGGRGAYLVESGDPTQGQWQCDMGTPPAPTVTAGPPTSIPGAALPGGAVVILMPDVCPATSLPLAPGSGSPPFNPGPPVYLYPPPPGTPVGSGPGSGGWGPEPPPLPPGYSPPTGLPPIAPPPPGGGYPPTAYPPGGGTNWPNHPLPSATISVNPAECKVGAPVTLTWTTSNADTIAITCQPAVDGWQDITTPLSGSTSLTPLHSGSFVFTLKATDSVSGNSVSQTCVLTVDRTPPTVQLFAPAEECPGAEYQVSWQVSGEVPGTITVTGYGANAPETGQETVTMGSGSATFTLTCGDTDGTTDSVSVSVDVPPSGCTPGSSSTGSSTGVSTTGNTGSTGSGSTGSTGSGSTGGSGTGGSGTGGSTGGSPGTGSTGSTGSGTATGSTTTTTTTTTGTGGSPSPQPQAPQIRPDTVYMCPGASVLLLAQNSLGGSWSTSSSLATMNGSVFTAPSFTSPGQQSLQSLPFAGTVAVYYVDATTGLSDAINIVVNSSYCTTGSGAGGGSGQAPPVTDPVLTDTTDPVCQASDGFPALQFAPASAFYEWPAQLLQFAGQMVRWFVVPPACVLPQLQHDAQTFFSSGLFALPGEWNTAIAATATCVGPHDGILRFVNLADFAGGGGCNQAGFTLAMEARRERERQAALNAADTRPLTLSRDEGSPQANAQDPGPVPFQMNSDPLPDELDLSALSGVLGTTRTILAVGLWVGFLLYMQQVVRSLVGMLPSQDLGGQAPNMDRPSNYDTLLDSTGPWQNPDGGVLDYSQFPGDHPLHRHQGTGPYNDDDFSML